MPQPVPNLRHLQVFREVMRRGSVNAAARAVHLSQPAVTQAIAAIERVHGVQLFDRTHRGMNATGAGRLCLVRVERALEQLRDGVAEVRRSRSAPDTDVTRTMTTRQLQALAAVVEHHGFGPAARALGSSGPALHRAARELERVLAVPLFERTSFGVGPTREAEQLARRARLAFSELEQAWAEISALEGGDRGRTVIGAMPLARSVLVPRTVLEFSSEHPEHAVEILDGPYESMLESLRIGAADVLIGALRDPVPGNDVVQEHLFDDPLAIVVRNGHPLARRRRPSVPELARFPWIMPRAGAPLRRQVDALFRNAGVALPAGAIECNSLVASRAMLLDSDRVMLLSAHQIHHEHAAGELTALPHPDGNVARAIGLTTRRGWHPTATQERLLDILRSQAGRVRRGTKRRKLGSSRTRA